MNSVYVVYMHPVNDVYVFCLYFNILKEEEEFPKYSYNIITIVEFYQKEECRWQKITNQHVEISENLGKP